MSDIFDGRFYISSTGLVKNSTTGRYIVGDINNFGYYRVELWYKKMHKKFFRHRLVAKYFIFNDDPEHKKFVNHIDGDKSNNCIENLEWVTKSENEKHAFKIGLKPKPTNFMPIKIITVDGDELYFEDQHQAANYFNIWQSDISYCYRKKHIPPRLKNLFISVESLNA